VANLVRNVFDQYSQAENKLTHALFSALQQDRQLLTSFLKDICRTSLPSKARDLKLSVQSYPDGTSYNNKEVESRNIPDAWIYDDEGWALVFEAKITAKLTRTQLEGHRRVAVRRGFDNAKFFAIVANENVIDVDGWAQIQWSQIYSWLIERRTSSHKKNSQNWAAITAEYFETLEANLLDTDKLGTAELTTFSGFLGGEDEFSYVLAKSKLKTAMRELRKDENLINQLNMNPDGEGRGAITGVDSDAVWDFLRLSDAPNTGKFTTFPHLTLGVGRRAAEAMVTFPNGLNTKSRNSIKSLKLEGFRDVCSAISNNVTEILDIEPNARPIMRVAQRRYRSQRSIPIMDALLEFDLRTAFERVGKGPKTQEQWIDALFNSFDNKSSNYQFQIGVVFDYAKCDNMNKRRALDLMANSWIACKPLIDVALGK